MSSSHHFAGLSPVISRPHMVGRKPVIVRPPVFSERRRLSNRTADVLDEAEPSQGLLQDEYDTSIAGSQEQLLGVGLNNNSVGAVQNQLCNNSLPFSAPRARPSAAHLLLDPAVTPTRNYILASPAGSKTPSSTNCIFDLTPKPNRVSLRSALSQTPSPLMGESVLESFFPEKYFAILQVTRKIIC